MTLPRSAFVLRAQLFFWISRCDYQKLGQPVTSEVMHLANCHVLDQSSRGKSTLTGS